MWRPDGLRPRPWAQQGQPRESQQRLWPSVSWPRGCRDKGGRLVQEGRGRPRQGSEQEDKQLEAAGLPSAAIAVTVTAGRQPPLPAHLPLLPVDRGRGGSGKSLAQGHAAAGRASLGAHLPEFLSWAQLLTPSLRAWRRDPQAGPAPHPERPSPAVHQDQVPQRRLGTALPPGPGPNPTEDQDGEGQGALRAAGRGRGHTVGEGHGGRLSERPCRGGHPPSWGSGPCSPPRRSPSWAPRPAQLPESSPRACPRWRCWLTPPRSRSGPCPAAAPPAQLQGEVRQGLTGQRSSRTCRGQGWAVPTWSRCADGTAGPGPAEGSAQPGPEPGLWLCALRPKPTSRRATPPGSHPQGARRGPRAGCSRGPNAARVVCGPGDTQEASWKKCQGDPRRRCSGEGSSAGDSTCPCLLPPDATGQAFPVTTSQACTGLHTGPTTSQRLGSCLARVREPATSQLQTPDPALAQAA